MYYEENIEKTRNSLEKAVKTEKEFIEIVNIVIEMIKILQDEREYFLKELWRQENNIREIWVILEWTANDSSLQIMISPNDCFDNLYDDIERYAELTKHRVNCEFATVLRVEKFLKTIPNIMVEGTKYSKSQDYTILIVF